jgi:hypothetical protein
MRSAGGQMRRTTTAEVRLDEGKATSSGAARQAIPGFRSPRHASWATLVAPAAQKRDDRPRWHRNPGNVG